MSYISDDEGLTWGDAVGDDEPLGAEMVDSLPTYAEGYAFGITGYDPRGYAQTFTLGEARAAIEHWREAASDHGHASYWGMDYIRSMRSFWLGYARGLSRKEELSA